MNDRQWCEVRKAVESVRYGRVTLYVSPDSESVNLTVEHKFIIAPTERREELKKRQNKSPR